MAAAVMSPISSKRTSSKRFMPAAGMRSTMPAKMIRETPLPMPDSVICSPSHMTKMVPAVSVSTVTQ